MRAPRAIHLTAWGNAVLAGVVSLDEAVERITGRDARHRVAGMPDEPDEVGLTLAIGSLRRLRTVGLGLALPVPGDVCGLPGPPAFNAEAVDAGECVLAIGDEAIGLVPEVTLADGSAYVVWRVHPTLPARPGAQPSLAEAERELAETTREVTEELIRMDVARAYPEIAARLAALRADEPDHRALAPNYPARAHRVLAQAQRLQGILALATSDPGAAVSARAIASRSDVLGRLGPVTRRAMIAAANSVLEPG